MIFAWIDRAQKMSHGFTNTEGFGVLINIGGLVAGTGFEPAIATGYNNHHTIILLF